ncbi:acyltransferase [Pandoraea cepalis]|uniref:Acyltransferase n=2 Tax=Pandoraea cepalis TaxID=2508294 RepID=A0AAW7MKM5_9BURK|nr:acyltransferase [Pandoraea cepalis]MDN4577617.1 acyltransferase [Pandoraea cepalis]
MSVGLRSSRIDMLRGISILLVLFHHFNIAYPLKDTVLSAWLGWPVVRAVARNGNYGVTIFFAISGFLITSNAIRRWGRLKDIELFRFYALRAARIVPCVLLLVCMVGALSSAGVVMFQNRGFGEPALPMWMTSLASLTFWMNVLIERHGWVNYPLGVLWSLSVEEMFYLSFPVVCLLLRRERWMCAFWTLFIVAGPLYRFAHQGDEAGFLYAYLACFDSIAIGCCAAVLAERGFFSWMENFRMQVAVVLVMTLLYLICPIAESNVLGVTVMAASTALLLLGWSTNSVSPGSVSGRTLAACGRVSYEIYLFHLIVLGLMRTALPPQMASSEEKVELMVVYFILSVVVSLGVAKLYTEPLNRVVRRWLQSGGRQGNGASHEAEPKT